MSEVSIQKILSHVKKYDLKIGNTVSIKKIQNAITALNTKTNWNTKQRIMEKHDWEPCLLGLYGSFQKMRDVGIDLNESTYWFINNYGKNLTAQYMYQALIHAVAKKGLLCLVNFYYILPEEEICFERKGDQVCVNYKDKGIPKNITVDTIANYEIFACVINIKNINNQLLCSDYITMTPEDINKRRGKSSAKNKGDIVYNYKLKKLAPKEEESIWEQWTKEMIDKTMFIRSMNIIKHSFPAIQEVMQFGDLEEDDICDSDKTEPKDVIGTEDISDKPIELFNFKNPSDEIKKQAKQIEEEYETTPEIKVRDKRNILEGLDTCQDERQKKMLINKNVAIILALGEKSRIEIIKHAGL